MVAGGPGVALACRWHAADGYRTRPWVRTRHAARPGPSPARHA